MAEKREFVIESIWATESVFKAVTPVHMLKKEWKPSASLDLDVKTSDVEGKKVVDLIITVAVTIEKMEIFTLKSVHTGVFNIVGYEDEELEQILESFCPSIIYPYAREKISTLVSNAGYPPLHLSPVDFEARFRASKEKAEK